MPGSPARRIAIIGGGFAGVVAAIKIIVGSTGRIDLTLVEPREGLGRGIAYSTDERDHLVNGVAGGFTLGANDPGVFVRWLQEHGSALGWVPPPGTSYAESSPPRALYGAYIEHELERVVGITGGRVRLLHVHDRAVALDAGTLTLASGGSLDADQFILATGLFRKETDWTASLGSHRAYIPDPFAPGAFDAVESAGQVILLGSGLTMLDSLISLEKRGFRGSYVVVSRRGLLVERRRDAEPWPDVIAGRALPRTVPAMLRLVQQQRRACLGAGDDWQRLPALLRQHIIPFWQGLSDRERARFVRHLGAYWNVAQHRASPPSYAFLERVKAQGRFHSIAGTVNALEATPRGVRALVRLRSKQHSVALDADLIVNALGYEFDWNRIADPLARNLVASGQVSPHPIGFGIRADTRTHGVIGRDGRVSTTLFAIGHALRAELWEASSMREQLSHADRLAGSLNGTQDNRQVA